MKLSFLSLVALAGVLAGCAREQTVEYTKPLSSPGSKFSSLPPTVQNTVRAQAGAAEISDVWKSTNFGPLVYEVRFKNSDQFPPLYIAPDGSVLTSNLEVSVGATEDTVASSTGGAMSGLKLGDLPPDVVKTIHAKAPTAEVDHITKVLRGDNVFYEVSFKDEVRNPKLFIAASGMLVEKE
jgi:hypothetical protein